MGEYTIKLPDVGEGVAEAEIVEWHVEIGDLVREDTLLAAVMTDKATVEIPSPVDGEVLWLGAAIGDRIAVGAPLIRLKVAEGATPAPAAGEPAQSQRTPPGRAADRPARKAAADEPAAGARAPARSPVGRATDPPAAEAAPVEPGAPRRGPTRRPAPPSRSPGAAGIGKPIASPAVRLSAREAGVDLRRVRGSGPAGRIEHDDLEAYLASAEATGAPAAFPTTALRENHDISEIKLVGLRRRIAHRMVLAKSRIPHITYVEEVDVTALEDLRQAMNRERHEGRTSLTVLPFLMRAMVKAIAAQPGVNAHFDEEAGTVRRFGGVHIGIATQTPGGLLVPVVRHAEARDVWGCAAELARRAQAARDGTAGREELSGSTITITSLGRLGGVVTTPIINHPEVAIVGVNKIMVRPMWDGARFVPRKMMNLSSSFDHRVVDGWDAASFVQRIKTLLETPALIFVEG
jgi:2-oxoisovalerate dehydrogenase E2 component (dihydrolipoyl transacylase)